LVFSAAFPLLDVENSRKSKPLKILKCGKRMLRV
jgi:hypothetical protein